MKKEMISYKITINYVNGESMIVYNSFKNVLDIIKNYALYRDVKSIKVNQNIFSNNKT